MLRRIACIIVFVVFILNLTLLPISPIIAAPPQQPPEGEAYTVQAGDNLSTLALRFYGDRQGWQRIIDATNEKALTDPTYQTVNDPSLIVIGKKLWIPASNLDEVVSDTPTPTPVPSIEKLVLSTLDATTPVSVTFNEGLAPIELQGRFGYLDEVGNLKIPAQFESATPFRQGIAAVSLAGKFGYIDQNGQFVIGPKLSNVASTTSELPGYVPVEIDTGSSEAAMLPRLEPFSDTTGLMGYRESVSNKIVIQPQFEAADLFSEDVAAVVIDGNVGYIDTTGAVVIEPSFDEGSRFYEGLASVVIDDKVGYIDLAGNTIIEPTFDDIGLFSEGLAPAAIDGKVGYINLTGTVVIAPIFDQASAFSDSLACVIIDNIPGIISTDGTFIPELYIYYTNPDDYCSPDAVDFGIRSTLSQFDGVLYGYKDEANNIVIPPQYDEAAPFSDGIALVRNEAGYKVIAPNGETVVVGPDLIRQVNYYNHDEFDIVGRFEGECSKNSGIVPDGYTCQATKALNGTDLSLIGEELDRCLLIMSGNFVCLRGIHNVGVEIQPQTFISILDQVFVLAPEAPPWRIMVTGNVMCNRVPSNPGLPSNQLAYICADDEWILGETQQLNETVWLARKGQVLSPSGENPQLTSSTIVAILETWGEWIPAITLDEVPATRSEFDSASLPTQPPPWLLQSRNRITGKRLFIRRGRFR